MDIKISYLIEGSKGAKGIVVIIDVLRACTTIPILLKNGAQEITPVKTAKEAQKYGAKGYILIGEGQHGAVNDTFHYNNSPSEVHDLDFNNKKIVIRTNNATQAILNAEYASEIVLASFVNLDSVANYIQNHHIKDVTLVALGRLGRRGLEDDLCAEAIKARLEGKEINFSGIIGRLYDCECAALVRKQLNKPDDVKLSLQLNTYPIVPKVYLEKGRKVIRPAN